MAENEWVALVYCICLLGNWLPVAGFLKHVTCSTINDLQIVLFKSKQSTRLWKQELSVYQTLVKVRYLMR